MNIPLDEHKKLEGLLRAAVEEGADLLPVLKANRAHLASCPRCHKAALLLFQSFKSSVALTYLEEQGLLIEPPAYPRFDLGFLEHPAAGQLEAYELGALFDHKKQGVARHLTSCRPCQKQLASLARSRRFQLSGRLGRTIQALQTVLVTGGVGAAVSRDGADSTTGFQLFKEEKGDLTLTFSCAPAFSGSEEVNLTGLVYVGEQVPAEIISARVELYLEEGLVGIESVEDFGVVTFKGLNPGIYVVTLLWKDREVRCSGVNVK